MANLQTKVPSVKLNDGTEIPMLGFGTGTAMYKSSGDTSIDRERVSQIQTALRLGYRHFDGAEGYGTERELGAAIKESGVAREELFVTTKVGSSVRDIPNAIDASLQKLKLDYVDLYLIHEPFWAKSDAELQEAWAAMEAVKASGKARSVGVSNYLRPQLEAVLATAKIPPSINQIEFHPYLQHTDDLVGWCKSKGVALASYSPLTAATKAKPGPCDGVLAKCAKKYAVSEGEVSLRWCIDQGIVAITTSSKEQRLSDYMRALAFKLTPKEMEDISERGREKHFRVFWQKKFDGNDRS